MDPGPVARGADWLAHVNEPETEAELARLRQSVGRAALGLEFALRPRGRGAAAEEGLFGGKE